MPLLRNDSAISQSWTIEGFANFLKAGFAQAGMGATPLDEFDSGGWRYLVWEKVADAARAHGKFYLVIAFNSEGLRQAVCASYDAENDLLPNQIQWSLDIGLNSLSDYSGLALRSDEAGMLLLISSENAQSWLIGWLRPAGKPAFWNEETAPYVFCSRFDDDWISTELSPYQEDSGYGLSFGRFRDSFSHPSPTEPTPISNQPNIVPGGYLYSVNFGSRAGFVGALSSDWGVASTRYVLPGYLIQVASDLNFMVLLGGFFERGSMVASIAPQSVLDSVFTSVPGSLISVASSSAPPGTPCQFVPIDIEALASEIAERLDLEQVCRWEPCPTPTPTPTPTPSPSAPTEGQLFP